MRKGNTRPVMLFSIIFLYVFMIFMYGLYGLSISEYDATSLDVEGSGYVYTGEGLIDDLEDEGKGTSKNFFKSIINDNHQ